MVPVASIILLTLLNFSLAKDCIINTNTPHMLWEKQLRKDLKCSYSTYVAPKSADNTTLPVTVRFILKYFSFDSDEEILSLQVWMFTSWVDTRLKWDPEKYGGIKETQISSYNIWAPSFLLYNSADSEDYERFFLTRCTIKNNGAIMCAPRTVHNTRCSVKLTDFPYDVQECTVRFGPWIFKDQYFNMNVTSHAISMWGADYGSQWMISDYKQEFSVNTPIQLNMTFVLEREADSLASVIVYPSIIISSLTIACLFLDVRSNNRLYFVCFNIFSHFYWLSELGENIPKESPDPPRILLYYRGTMVLSVLLLPLTVVLSLLCKKITAPHNLIVTINNYVYEGFARFLVYPRWDIEGTVSDETKYTEVWTKFANVINSFSTIIILITYIGLYFAFVPQPVPIKY